MKGSTIAWLITGLCGLPVAGFADGPDISDVRSALELRYKAIGAQRIRFSMQVCKCARSKDPFERTNWDCYDATPWRYDCIGLILRPWFQISTECTLPVEYARVHSWVGGRRTTNEQEPDGTVSIGINRNWWHTFGPLPVLAALELQLFDLGKRLDEALVDGDLRAERARTKVIRLKGKLSRRNPPATVDIELDEKGGLVPLVMRASVPLPEGGAIEYEMRVLSTRSFGDYAVMESAIFVVKNPRVTDNSVYFFTAGEIALDPSLSEAQLEISIPERGFALGDDITGTYEQIDRDGRVIYSVHKTPEQVEYDNRLAAEAMQASLNKPALLAERKKHMGLALSSGAAVAVIALGGILLWRRHRHA